MLPGERESLQPVTAAADLFHCLRSLAARRSNPVLELLAGRTLLREGEHLPEPPLDFGAGPWRAYYHCHDAPGRRDFEHGHFHVFVRAGRAWSHLAALVMDHEGQPREWVAVNHWVTAGRWLPAPVLRSRVHDAGKASGRQAHGLVEGWLLGMLGLFRDELGGLLDERDRRLLGLAAGRPLKEVLEDRSFYAIARCAVDLEGRLRAALAGPLNRDGGVR